MDRLPNLGVRANILSGLDARSLLNSFATNHLMHCLSNCDAIWRPLVEDLWPGPRALQQSGSSNNCFCQAYKRFQMLLASDSGSNCEPLPSFLARFASRFKSEPENMLRQYALLVEISCLDQSLFVPSSPRSICYVVSLSADDADPEQQHKLVGRFQEGQEMEFDMALNDKRAPDFFADNLQLSVTVVVLHTRSDTVCCKAT